MPGDATAIQPGFSDPVHQSQQVFRRVLDAMAHPGRVQVIAQPPAAAPGLSRAATAVCLSLLDFETPVWLDDVAADARDFLGFHCGVPVTPDPAQAAFAVIGDYEGLGDLDRFNTGTDERPDTSTTLVIEVESLVEGSGRTLAGPGIAGHVSLDVGGVDADFWQGIADNRALFPRGVDVVLTCGDRLAALPRSVRLLAED
jgi:alpha-D-ribose 1-methylphosphonate 5-triphosphate synthase subunit PhnH